MTLIRKNWSSFLDLRLLIITPNQWLRVYNGKMDGRRELIENAMIEQLARRGDILDFFSKLKSLIKEIVQAMILGLFSPKVKEFDDILLKVHFAGCMLGQMESDKGQPEKKIKELTKVRNELAHSWSESDVILQERRKRKSYQSQKQYKRI